MKIYIAHSKNSDYKEELYVPLQNSSLAKQHELILPHQESSSLFSSKEFFQSGCDLIIAEVSYPATGLGIELGWANVYNTKIICVHKPGVKVARSLQAVSDTFLEYENSKDLIDKLEVVIL